MHDHNRSSDGRPVRVRFHLPTATESGAALCSRLSASSRRYHRPIGQIQSPGRTQDWIKLGGKVQCRTYEGGVRQAEAPARLIEGGLPTEAIAQVLVSKYARSSAAILAGPDLRPPRHPSPTGRCSRTGPGMRPSICARCMRAFSRCFARGPSCLPTRLQYRRSILVEGVPRLASLGPMAPMTGPEAVSIRPGSPTSTHPTAKPSGCSPILFCRSMVTTASLPLEQNRGAADIRSSSDPNNRYEARTQANSQLVMLSDLFSSKIQGCPVWIRSTWRCEGVESVARNSLKTGSAERPKISFATRRLTRGSVHKAAAQPRSCAIGR